ncbi:hypothetical protein ACFQ48_20825 [Hymenobacter caeli]
MRSIVVAQWVLLAASCATPGRVGDAKLKNSGAAAPAACDFDVENYSKQINAAFTRKVLELNEVAARKSDTSLAEKFKIPVDNILLNGANWTRKRALEQLCAKCGASILFRQDSLSFIEVYSKGYCDSYTLYVLDRASKGIVYQRVCSQPICKVLTKAVDSSLLNIEKGEYFDVYKLFYVKSKRVNNVFITEGIAFLGYGAVKEELF